VFNTLLQVLDDGRITDAQGRTVDFRNTVSIVTFNLGSMCLLDALAAGGETESEAREGVTSELHRHFRPEFLNRIDHIVLFKALTRSKIEHIVDLMFDDLQTRLADRGLGLSISEQVLEFIAEQGFDPVYGQWPLRGFIAREGETRIGCAPLGGLISPPGPPFAWTSAAARPP
jgi:ATP-dependent Clp protease ATP-binding subunit ClpB